MLSGELNHKLRLVYNIPGRIMNRMDKRNHRILNHAIVGYFLLLIFVSIVESTLGTGLDKLLAGIIPDYAVKSEVAGQMTESAMGVGVAVSALVALLLFKFWFRPSFEGCLSKDGLKEGLLMLLPFLVFHYTGSIVSCVTLGTGNVLIALLRATAPGFGEEVMFRGLGVANYMRTIRSKNQIKVIFWLSSVVFGMIHLENIMAGGDPKSVVIQAFYATGVGMLFGAVYLRTGNLWPTILGHWSVDFVEMIRADLYASGGVMTGMGVGDWITVAASVFAAVWAIRLMNPKYHDEIMEIWAKKWNRSEPQDVSADAVEEI
ncbi:MAG: CPBP family intramembrane metalloprotease [Clostridiales bacterium]|nr:CPBP family intramembrane metalloprotease [Clostridiales bacterium]